MAIILRIIILLLLADNVLAQDIGINYRATAAYVTDGTNETYSRCQSDLYPVTRGGFTFGWNNFIDMERDRNNALDRRLAGICQIDNASAQQTWRIDLGAGSAGQYDISLASGDANFAKINYLQLLDSNNTTVLLNINGVATTAGNFLDATGVNRTAANWPSQHVKLRVTLSGTSAYIRLGQNGGAGDSSAIAHLRFEKVAGGGGGLPLRLRAIGED